MRTEQPNELESLAGELPPEMILLAAMLRDQIETLALLWSIGWWEETPAELRPARNGGDVGRYAVEERHLWGAATDALIGALERYTPIRIDRGRIVALARQRGERLRSQRVLGKNQTPGRAGMALPKSDVAAMRKVMRQLTRDRIADFEVPLATLTEMCRESGVCPALPPLATPGMEPVWREALEHLATRPDVRKPRYFVAHRRRWRLRPSGGRYYAIERIQR